MRVAFFTESYHPIINGVIVSIDTYKKALEKKGIECFVFTPSSPNYKDKEKNIFRFRSLPYPVRVDYRLPLPLPVTLFKKINELQIDIIHTHSPFFTGAIALYLARKNKLPLVFTHHTQYHQYVHYVPLLPRQYLQNSALAWSRFYCNKCDLIIAPSNGLKTILKNYNVEKEVVVLPTGVDLTDYQDLDTEFIKKKYDIKDKSVIITVSRLAKEKNIEFLLEIFAEVKKVLNNVVYFIVGGGPSYNSLKKYAQELGIISDVVFTGFVEKKDVLNYLASADIFLFASKTETQGLVVLEAMAAGCVPICLDATGLNEMIDDGVNGFVLPENIEYFKSKIVEVLKNNELKKELSSSALQKAKYYDSNELVNELINWYNKIRKCHKNS